MGRGGSAMKRMFTNYYCDLETVVYPGQTKTAAWSAAVVSELSDDVFIHHSLKSMWEWLKKQRGNLLLYYHNLKFDGFFWIDFFLRNNVLKQALVKIGDNYQFKKVSKLQNGEFIYSINKLGQWYTITIKQHNRLIQFRDSLKLLPFSLKKIGEAFKTKHQKLEMEYEGLRYPGCHIKDEEIDYIKNDVYVEKEGLEAMFALGYDSLTIGSCCLKKFKEMIGEKEFDAYYPNLYKDKISEKYFSKSPNYNYSIGEYVLKSYKGAWCYVEPDIQGQVLDDGITLDVTSLYSSVMHSISGNKYPYGHGKIIDGKLPDMYFDKDGRIKTPDNQYAFVRFTCAFDVKEGYLPFIQIKDNWLYPAKEHLKTSDVFDRKNNIWKRYRTLDNGGKERITVTLTMCEDEYNLFLEHYKVENLQFLDACLFAAGTGFFDEYIDKYFHLKSSTDDPVLRTIGKLMLNNLYGKFATTPDSSFKYLMMGEDNLLHYKTQIEHEKTPGYIAVGAAITAKARAFIIRAAQCNKEHFCYCDTDSLHLTCTPEEAKGVVIAKNKLCTFKVELKWKKAIFARQKSYIEVEKLDNNLYEYHITCAGMPDRCKDLLKFSISRQIKDLKPLAKKIGDHYVISDEQEYKFLCKKRKLEDFKGGLVVPSKLYSQTLEGGTILYKDNFTLKELDNFYKVS